MMRRLINRARQRRLDGDKGVAMVEMAIVAPFLALIVAGIVEYGTLWRDDLTVTSATRSAARVISNAGDTEGADYEGIQSLRAALESIDGVTIEGMLVYNASAVDGEPNSSCFLGDNPVSSTGWCNYYSAAQIQSLTPADFSACTGPDASWCPTGRDDNQTGGTDKVGVWVRINREYFTGLIPGDGVTITDFSVMNIEPEPS
ncbi:MAG: TadE/TadG family type IV pilus assembly protein [Acidimicrobiales bacterium]|nr:TadE/TadG family type IV pilus assembly protein [Acidimicrobiales bacterium]